MKLTKEQKAEVREAIRTAIKADIENFPWGKILLHWPNKTQYGFMREPYCKAIARTFRIDELEVYRIIEAMHKAREIRVSTNIATWTPEVLQKVVDEVWLPRQSNPQDKALATDLHFSIEPPFTGSTGKAKQSYYTPERMRELYGWTVPEFLLESESESESA